MELHYSPFACSLAARIVCLEIDLPITYRRTDLATKRVAGLPEGALLALNPMGKVPTLVCADGRVLTENIAVLMHLGDHAPPGKRVVPEPKTPEGYALLQWLSFIATEMHKGVLGVVFALDDPPEAAKVYAQASSAKTLAVLDEHLRDRSALVGEGFTVADAYLIWALLVLTRSRCGVSLASYPAIDAYRQKVGARESVVAAIRIEREEYKEPGWWTAQALPGAG